MATELYFKVDGNYYPLPGGWDAISLVRSFDGRELRTEISGTLEFKADLYDLFRGYLAADPCREIELEFTYKCLPSPKELLLRSGKMRLKEGTDNCTECVLKIPVKDFSRLASIEKGQEVCVPISNEMDLYQIETGATYLDFTGLSPLTTGVMPVYMLLKNISDFFYDGSGGIVSDLLGAGGDLFQAHRHKVEMPTIAGPAAVTITLINEFGSIINGTVYVPGTGYSKLALATRLRNVLLYMPYINIVFPGDLDREELVNRISSITIIGTDLHIETDYEVSSLEIKVDGLVQAGLVTELQPFVYGIKNLAISTAGLAPEGEICLSWEAVTNALYSLFNIVVIDSGQDIEIQKFEDVFDPAGPVGSPDIQNRRIESSFDPTWLVDKVQFGNPFKLSAVDASVDSWEWVLQEYIIPSKQPFTPQPIPQGGVISVHGQICIENIGPGNQLGVGMDLYIGGVPIASGLGLGDFYPGTKAIIDFPSLFAQTSTPNAFCITAGTMIEWRFVGGVVPTGLQLCAQQPKNQYRVEYEMPCITSPMVDEKNPDQEYNSLLDFPNCKGVRDLRIPGSFYTGLGYAISQQAQKLASYDDTFFLIESDTGYSAKKYRRDFYFATGEGFCSSCWEDSIKTFWYYNMLLQRPHIIRNFRSAVPSDIGITAYEINNFCNPIDVYSSSINEVPRQHWREQGRIKTYQMEIRQTPDEYLERESDNLCTFSGCGLTGHRAQILSMEYNLKTGRGNIKLLSD